MTRTPQPLRVDVAVIVVTHNSREQVPDLVAAVRAGASASAMRLVFVDSGSTDDTVDEVARVAPQADVLALDGNRGYAAGINAGVAHVRASGGSIFYLLANPDMFPDPGAIDTLVAALERPGVGVACPRLRGQDGRRQDSLRAAPTIATTWAEALIGGPLAARLRLPSEAIRGEGRYAVEGAVGWATGGLVAVSEACARDVGPWTENLFLYEEEVDFCVRAAERGWVTWYVPEADAVRSVDDSELAPWRQALMRRNRVRRVSTRSRATGVAVASGLALGDALRSVLGRPEARAGLWAVLHRATPEQVMRRYAPWVEAPVVAQPGTPPSVGHLRHAGWRAPA